MSTNQITDTKQSEQRNKKASQQKVITEQSESDNSETYSNHSLEPTGPKIMDFSFLPDKIMTLLSKDMLKKLQKHWESVDDGLDIVEFTKLILSKIYTKNDDEKYELVYGCYKLFQQVDINGDGGMDWGEFVQYIVDAVAGSAIQSGDGQESVRDQLTQLKAMKFTKFGESRTPLDKSTHQNTINQCVNCHSTKVILMIEKFAKELKFYKEDMTLERKIKVPMKKEGFITAITYNDKQMIYACASSDKHLYFYKKGKVKMEFYRDLEAECIQTRIWYLPKQDLWLSAGIDKKLRHWSLEKSILNQSSGDRESKGGLLQEVDFKFNPDGDVFITDCVEINFPRCIAVSYIGSSRMGGINQMLPNINNILNKEKERNQDLANKQAMKNKKKEASKTRQTSQAFKTEDVPAKPINIKSQKHKEKIFKEYEILEERRYEPDYGAIILYDIEHNEQLKKVSAHHKKGIRFLRYQQQNGGHMVSIGNEIYANVWAPESYGSDMHVGKLSGHKKSIIDGQFLNNAPYFITIDALNITMIWDIKTLTCVQIIARQLNYEATGLVIISNNIFWGFGKRFFQYDTYQIDPELTYDDDGTEEEGVPLTAQLNEYLLNEIVVKKQEIRMYDIETGKLNSIYNNIFKDNNNNIEITIFKIDKRHRKAYVATNTGRIYVINCQNGVVLKNVTQYQEEKEQIKKSEMVMAEDITSLGSSNYESNSDDMNIYEDNPPKKKKEKKRPDTPPDRVEIDPKGEFEYSDYTSDEETKELQKIEKMENPEINDLCLIWEEYTKNDEEVELIMCLCTTQNEVFIYDESDTEESRLLRRISGAHEEEITILAYNFHLSLIATGCVNGEIALYDFEMSRLDGLLKGHTGDITALEFLSPYPLLFSASMDSTVCIWGVRPIIQKYYNICIKKFQNISWDNRLQKDVNCSVSRFAVWSKEMKGIKQHRRRTKNCLPAPVHRLFDLNWVFAEKDPDQIWEEEIQPLQTSILSRPSDSVKMEAALKSKLYQEILEDDKRKFFITQVQDINSNYNDTIDEEKQRMYIFIGDELGFLKIWNLTQIIEHIGVEPCVAMNDGGKFGEFNPYRLEKCNLSEIAKIAREEQNKQEIPMPIDPAMTGYLVREVKAHQDDITSIQKIELHDFDGLITCGKDNKVRNWNLNLDLLGNINLNSDIDDPKWKFPSKEKTIKQNIELKEIENLIDELQEEENTMGLKYPRRELVVDNDRVVEKVQEKLKSRANWFAIQEENKKRELEMIELQKQQQRDLEYQNARSNLMVNKIERTILEQDIKMQQLKMNIPLKMEEGMFRDLQNQLNGRQNDLVNGLKQELGDQRKQQQLLEIDKQSTMKTFATEKKVTQRTKMTKKGTSYLTVVNPQQSIRSSSNLNMDPLYESMPTQESRVVSKTSREVKEFFVPTPKQRTKSLQKMVEESKQNEQFKKFQDSKTDRDNILALQSIPNLRSKLASLQKKDRFKAETPHETIKGKINFPKNRSGVQQQISPPSKFRISPPRINKQSAISQMGDYLTRLENLDRNAIIARSIQKPRFLQHIVTEDRPLSIPASEIQKVSDLGDKSLIKDQSSISLSNHNKHLESGEISLKIGSVNKILEAPMPQIQIRPNNLASISPSQDSKRSRKNKDQLLTVQNQDGQSVTIAKQDLLYSNQKRKILAFGGLQIHLPIGVQDGSSVSKRISRNPLGISNTQEVLRTRSPSKKEKLTEPSFHEQSYDQSIVSTRQHTDRLHGSQIHPLMDRNFNSSDNTSRISKPRKLNHVETTSLPRMKHSVLGIEQESEIARSVKVRKNISTSRNDSGPISRVSPRDIIMSQKFDEIKQKYQGQKSYLMVEKQLNKDRLAEQRAKMEDLRKSYKVNKI